MRPSHLNRLNDAEYKVFAFDTGVGKVPAFFFFLLGCFWAELIFVLFADYDHSVLAREFITCRFHVDAQRGQHNSRVNCATT